MANVLNPETESITLKHRIGNPNPRTATELEHLDSIDQPLRESTSNPSLPQLKKSPLWTPMPNPACR